MSIHLTKDKLTQLIEHNVAFPTGTPEQIYDYLVKTKQDFLDNKYPNYSHSFDGLEIKSVTFEDDWCGYEIHDYYLVVTLEESDEAYLKRQEEVLAIKKKQAEADKRKQEQARQKATKRKEDEIKALENRLAKLKGELNE